jgi:hypothetical protein
MSGDGADQVVDGSSGDGSGDNRDPSPNSRDELVPIGRVRDLQSANDKLRARLGELERQVEEAGQAAEAAASALAGAREGSLAHLRRALLAEHAGQLVPELVVGDSSEALEASVEVARAAFERAAESARTQLGAQRVPTGTPTRSGPSPESLTPLDKIAEGLRTSG